MHDSGQGDAFAQAMEAQRTAKAAVEKEQSNAEKLAYLQLRQAIMEEKLGLTDIIGEEIHRREVEARKIELPPHIVGDTVIPEGYAGHVENGHVVFRPVD